MDFDWVPSQRELYERAYRFAQSFKSADAEANHDSNFSRERWMRCGEFGVLGLCVPTQFGGMGLSALMTARIIEALGQGSMDAGLLFSATAHLFACTMPIAEFGTASQARRVVPKLARGEWIGANAITEADAGSDVFSIKTRAVRDGDTYVLDGTKTYVTNGPVADVFLVYAVTQPGRGFFGLSAFAVEKGTPGLIAGKPFPKVGLRAAPTGCVYLEGCRVAEAHRLGDEGQGGILFQASMAWERACLFAAYLGSMQRDLERAVTFARERRQFDRAIGKNQAISHRIANMKLRLEAARLLLYKACWCKDSGREATLDISLAKLAISEAAVQSGLDVIQIHGGLGITEPTLSESLLDALPSTIFSGTSEMQRDLISRSLGL
jgi:alkylation response protein AidB-like acyl-CoA dehydrogenase